MKLRTWHIETLVVAIVLVLTNLATHRGKLGWLSALAVLASFGHASISSRMAEKQAEKVSPDVECYRLAVWYFVAKEVLWVSYFLVTGAYAALVGCGIFIVHPIWRRFYTTRWRSR